MDNPYAGKRLFTSSKREVAITESYEGNGKDDPPGYYYHYVDTPHIRHWISARAVPIRFTAENFDQALTMRLAAGRMIRDDFFDAAVKAVREIAPQYGARVVVDSSGIAFAIVLPGDIRIEYATITY